MRHRAAAILFALAALAALPAAKPVPPGDAVQYTSEQLTPQVWRSQGVPVCVARLSANRALTPDDLEAICGCTFDSYLEGHGNNPLPGLADDHIPIALENRLLSCTARTRPDQRAAVRQLNITWRPGQPLPAAPEANYGKPADAEEAPADTEASSADSAGGGFWDWLGTWGWPAWLTGASVLWWIAGGIFVLGLLIMKVRRRDTRQDLSAPPSHMRRGAPPQPPRRPDLPR